MQKHVYTVQRSSHIDHMNKHLETRFINITSAAIFSGRQSIDHKPSHTVFNKGCRNWILLEQRAKSSNSYRTKTLMNYFKWTEKSWMPSATTKLGGFGER